MKWHKMEILKYKYLKIILVTLHSHSDFDFINLRDHEIISDGEKKKKKHTFLHTSVTFPACDEGSQVHPSQQKPKEMYYSILNSQSVIICTI